MRRFDVHNHKGFTLLEILVAAVIASTLTALTLPNLLAWLNSNKVQEATDTIQAALQDAPRQALRLGRNCTLNFTNGSGSNPTVYSQITASEVGCLVALNANSGSLALPREIFMVTNFPTQGSSPGVRFSFRGHVPGLTFIPPENQAMIVLYPAPNASAAPYPNQERKCLVIASLLGTIKQGTYNGTSLTNLDARQCQVRLDGTQPQ
jgi:prepilin-type N-terminal cleavage/methylation domain-containing protein